ncbi:MULTISPECIES: chemotaxis protein CheB [Methylomonas]|uniref:protein-glutamate O-methyltransferase n=2 Tax=Methylomonas TaxID=416 RepID=A0A126T8X5_9GAMM|nr:MULTISPECIES: chemotaxis protein CheB [Methylomonas]AMK78549.1 chemotaxis protein CheB [Methylomonas denitrificans]OAI06459.1 chemotaxis protein CheB [Methylomonas methanica]TCV77382.1 chemotaxis protein methyltransferase CheR/two-component system CheB/CheR fusion protein [Methylomonas methanica]
MVKTNPASLGSNTLTVVNTAKQAPKVLNTGKQGIDSDSTPPIIAIGTSAGGLEALEQFFTHVPPDCGVAFVVIQHLDPNHQGMLPELLQRVTPLTVTQAGDRMKIAPNWVYVIPPNKDLSILHGKLHLLEPLAPRGLRLPIDSFFRALAEDQHERAIGVILSGMGSDGTLGLRAIKENAGLAVVQTPESAQFDSMPRSAITAGVADIVATPPELWGKILAYLQHSPRGLHAVPEIVLELKNQSALEQIVILLRERTGNDFLLYKKNTIYRRIERRMGLHQIDSIAKYVRYLRENQQELDLLFKELLIGVTSFFRDPAVWESLKTDAIPTLLAQYPAGKSLRAWVAACSTGEEAYSLAIVFKEALVASPSPQPFKLQIFATDLDQDAIDNARQGIYPANIAEDMSAERLSKFFSKEGSGYRINKEIREMVIFAPHNVIMDPPFTKLDLLCCRNLLIYLSQELQKKLILLFHYTLANQGILLLGNAETTGNTGHLFTVIDNKSRLYRRTGTPFPLDVDFPTKFFPIAPMTNDTDKTPSIANLQTLADQLLLQHFSPAAVLVNAGGDILYISGRTGKYLEPAAGKANWNIHAMAREGLRHELIGALKKARGQVEAVHVSGLSVGTNGGSQIVNLTVQAITKPEALNGMLIVVFTDVAAPAVGSAIRKSASAAQKTLQIELQQTREDLQTLREEMQTSQEELKSANEELQSTNEELQSTNEELTTSKEEMQSLNEELQTVNAELQVKVDDLSRASNDMNNLLNSMEIATVFLDNALNIRRFTSHISHLFKVIAADVGRPLSDIVTDLDYPELQQDAQEVLRTLVFVEKQVRARDDRWFKVRIMPYRTQDNLIDGVVITFIDISETKKLEAELRNSDDKTP